MSTKTITGIAPNSFPLPPLNQQCKFKVPASKEGDSDVVGSLLRVIPQTVTLEEEVLDQYCYSLHKDENVDSFANLFSKVIKENAELFTFFAPQEKVDVLFNFHKKKVLEKISQKPEFSDFVKEVTVYFPSSANLVRQEALKILGERMVPLHTSFLSFSIGKALEIAPSKISFSTSVFNPRWKLKTSENISLY